MDTTVRHTFDVGFDAYWKDLFFCKDYQTALHMEGLNSAQAVVELHEEHDDGRIFQRVRIEPRVPMPGPIKKLLGDRVVYIEEGVFDPQDGRYRFKILPSVLASSSNIQGVLWATPTGTHQVERTCTLSVNVKVRGAGKILEKFISRSYEKNIDEAARFTSTYIARTYVPGSSTRLSNAQGTGTIQVG